MCDRTAKDTTAHVPNAWPDKPPSIMKMGNRLGTFVAISEASFKGY